MLDNTKICITGGLKIEGTVLKNHLMTRMWIDTCVLKPCDHDSLS